MSAPAVKLNANVDKVSALAFFSDVATAAANVSGGVFASDARTMSCLPLLFLTDGDVIIALLLGIIARRLMNAFLEDEEEIDRFAENDKNFALLSLEEEEEEEEEEDARAETLAAAAMVVLVLANIVLSIDIDMY